MQSLGRHPVLQTAVPGASQTLRFCRVRWMTARIQQVLKGPPDREHALNLGGDAVSAAILQPICSNHCFHDQIISDVPSHSGTDVPGKICLPRGVVTAVTNIPVPGIPIASRPIGVFQFSFEVLIPDSRCYVGSQTPINDVVVDIEATGLDERVLFKLCCARRILEWRLPTEGCTAEHEIGMDAEKIAEMPRKTEAAQAGIIHFGVNRTPGTVEADVLGMEVLADAVHFAFALAAERLGGPGNLCHGRKKAG